MKYLFVSAFAFCLFRNCSPAFTVPNDIAVSLDKLAGDGSDRYNLNDWSGTINSFEKALINFRIRQHVDSSCHGKCKNPNMLHRFHLNFTGFDDLHYIADLIAQAECIKLCIEEHPYGVVAIDYPDKKILEDFERRKPYNFLQYAYFQQNKLKRASQAALTYYHANLNDEQARNNVEFYQNEKETDESYFEDLEAPKFHVTYNKAVDAYEAKQYEIAILKFEDVLAEYFKSFEECQALCFRPIEQVNFYRFYKSTAAYFLDILDCFLECETKLSPISSGKKLDNFVALCFSYLQFSYYSTHNLTMAVPAAASVLLLRPNDESALKNMLYYQNQADKHGLSQDHYQGRKDATKYSIHLEFVKDLLKKRNLVLGEPDEEDVIDDAPDGISSSMDILLDEITAKLNEKLRSNSDR